MRMAVAVGGVIVAAAVAAGVVRADGPDDVASPKSSKSILDINESDTLGLGGAARESPGYRVTWYPSRSISRPDAQGDLGLVRQNLSAAVPLWVGDEDVLALSTGVENTRFSTHAVLPDSHRAFPDELWDAQLGLNYFRRSDDGRLYGAHVAFGSPSDKPFHSFDELDLTFMGLMQTPAKNARDAWRFLLIYAPASDVAYPIPGLAYLWNPSNAFHLSIGLPPALLWHPTERWTLDLSYLPVATAHVRATYRLLDTLSVYGGFESLQEGYFLVDRDSRRDRFLGFEERLVTGVRWDLWPHITWETSGGYAFDRSYGVGKSWFESLDDEVKIDPALLVSASLSLRF
jgi:hypothetical protein